MNQNIADRRGPISQNGAIMSVNNALVEEVSFIGKNSGYLVFPMQFLGGITWFPLSSFS